MTDAETERQEDRRITRLSALWPIIYALFFGIVWVIVKCVGIAGDVAELKADQLASEGRTQYNRDKRNEEEHAKDIRLTKLEKDDEWIQWVLWKKR